MAQLTLISQRDRPLRPLVEAALANERRLLAAAIRQTEQRLHEFEAIHGMPTEEFIRRYENDELEETLERTGWIGEYRLFQRLQEKREILQGIEMAD